MKIRKLVAILFAAVLLLVATATAAEEIDVNRNVSMTIIFQEDGAGLPDAQFNIFQIASLDPSGTPTVLSPFSRYPINLTNMSESSLAKIAGTLEGYVLRDGIEPDMRCTTNSAGKATLPGNSNSMKPGLYLVLGERYVHNGKVHTIQPTVVCLPVWDATLNRWHYDATLHIKSESRPDTPDRPKITRKVLKIWDKNGHEIELPQEVVIQLLQDGKVFDTVTLNAETLWRHTWTELEPDHHWTVVEQAIPDYNVVVTQEGITFVVTNEYSPENPPPITPDSSDTPNPTPTPNPSDVPGEPTPTPDPSGDPGEPTPTPDPSGVPGEPTPTPDPSDVPDEPSSTKKPKPTPPPEKPKLPQTGQLWWPIPMLVCAGLLLIIIGLLRRRR